VKRSIVDKARELGGLNATNQTLTEPEKEFFKPNGIRWICVGELHNRLQNRNSKIKTLG
jgi:hypothetical protein